MFFKKRSDKGQTVPGKKRSPLREWANAFVFAVVFATVFRTFLCEAYNIPSGSMEGSLLINDHLYVSKLAYGPRLPMTPVAVPLVHNTLPVTGGKSYSESVKLGYHRLPGLGKVQHNDIVVFNGPDGDTALAEEPEMDYYQACRLWGKDAVAAKYTIVTRPVDKKENLVKRCIGLPGDQIEIKNAVVYVNGRPAKQYPHTKMSYVVRTNGMLAGTADNAEPVVQLNSSTGIYNIENGKLDDVRTAANVVSVEPFIQHAAGVSPKEPAEWVFPLDTANYKWNRDNYGPITIPKAGTTVAINAQNIALYRRVIANYEGNTLEERDGKIIINGKEADSYTFKMDYYWMMGDNRHNSLDSRYWGFVPEDHIVGKAWFVWFSYGDNPVADIRWGRLLRHVHTLER